MKFAKLLILVVSLLSAGVTIYACSEGSCSSCSGDREKPERPERQDRNNNN